MLDAVRLVHMNGRVYDPFLARMISADPTVPGAFNGQAFNRYAYVFNNPLSLVDPSGFGPLGICGGTPRCAPNADGGSGGIDVNHVSGWGRNCVKKCTSEDQGAQGGGTSGFSGTEFLMRNVPIKFTALGGINEFECNEETCFTNTRRLFGSQTIAELAGATRSALLSQLRDLASAVQASAVQHENGSVTVTIGGRTVTIEADQNLAIVLNANTGYLVFSAESGFVAVIDFGAGAIDIFSYFAPGFGGNLKAISVSGTGGLEIGFISGYSDPFSNFIVGTGLAFSISGAAGGSGGQVSGWYGWNGGPVPYGGGSGPVRGWGGSASVQIVFTEYQGSYLNGSANLQTRACPTTGCN